MSAQTTSSSWHLRHRKQLQTGPRGEAITALKGAAPAVSLGVSALFQLGTLAVAVAFGQAWIPWWAMVPVAFVFGTWAVMARFVILHDLVHNTVVKTSRRWRTRLMRICDLPSISVGNYLYYRWGHIDHHRNLGVGGLEATLQSVDRADFDFFYHIDTMRFRRAITDTEPVDPPFFRKRWFVNAVIICMVRFVINLQYILMLPLMLVRGHPNFPNRPPEFHNDIRIQAAIVLVELVLLAVFGGWKALLYLYLAEVFFYFPLHPYFAFFMSSHPSHEVGDTCQPTTSIYAGGWYTVYSLAINHHVEHHDFPEIPWFRLPRLRRLSGSHYDEGARRGVTRTIVEALGDPPVYACGGRSVLPTPKPKAEPEPTA